MQIFNAAAAAAALSVLALLIHGIGATPSYEFDRQVYHRRLQVTIDFCNGSNYSNETCAQRWIDRFSNVSDYFGNIVAKIEFAFEVHMDQKLGNLKLNVTSEVQKWVQTHVEIARRFKWKQFSDSSLKRRFRLLTEPFIFKRMEDRKKLNKLQQQMQSGYTKAAACPTKGSCLAAGEHAVTARLQQLLASSSSSSSNSSSNSSSIYDEMQSVWKAWYDAAGTPLRQTFSEYVSMLNSAARADGFADAGVADWLLDFESKSFNSDVLAWWSQVSDLYRQLHAYVRWRLARRFPGKFNASGCLPAHILGDQWAQQWQLQPEDYPNPSAVGINVTAALQRKYKNFTELVHTAESFFASLGLPNMTQQFWQRSDFLAPAEAQQQQQQQQVKDCHAAAMEFSNQRDFRIKMCGRIDQRSFYTIHHEMGHVQYFMAYSKQPAQFRAGANSGFHEAVGDTIALSVNTDKHYRAVKIVQQKPLSKEAQLNRLFESALEKVAFLPFALTAGIFRWRTFNSSISERSYNRGWWQLRAELGGVCPPVDRPEVGFDAGSKYHIALDISYIRYYFSFILQFHLHSTLCSSTAAGAAAGAAGKGEDQVARCDFYKSHSAGRKLLRMLSRGSSQPWQEILREFSGSPKLSTSAILRYYQPLHEWLVQFNQLHRVPVGWQVPVDVLKGVSSKK